MSLKFRGFAFTVFLALEMFIYEMGLLSSLCEMVVVSHGIGTGRITVSKRIPIVVSFLVLKLPIGL
jgi:hypothetical protein